MTSLFFTTSVPKTSGLLPHRIHSLDVSCGARHLSPSFHSELEESSFLLDKGSLLTHTSHALLYNSQKATLLSMIRDCQVQIYTFSTADRPCDCHAGCWNSTLTSLPCSGELQITLPERKHSNGNSALLARSMNGFQ